MNELALFAGAGGGILGGKLLGWRTVCAVECDPYAASVLCARQNDGFLAPFPIWDDVRTFDGRPWRGRVDVVSGGFPCQDISAAGKGAGIGGERSGLWGEMARIIGEVGPRYVFVENSPMLTRRGLGVVLGDLAALGYNAEWGVLGAIHAGAPHKRERIWIVAGANADCGRCEWQRLEEHANIKSESGDQPNGLCEARRRNGSLVAHARSLGGKAGLADSPRGQAGYATVAFDGGDDRTAERQRERERERRMAPTPCASDWKGSMKNGQRRGQLTDPKMEIIPPGGQLNPTWVEWLMGWPQGWTDLKPLETDKSQQWLRSHGASCRSDFN